MVSLFPNETAKSKKENMPVVNSNPNKFKSNYHNKQREPAGCRFKFKQIAIAYVINSNRLLLQLCYPHFSYSTKHYHRQVSYIGNIILHLPCKLPQVGGGAVPSPPSTNQVPMFSTGKNSKSALLPSVINLTLMESIIDRMKTDIANVTNKIDLVHSTLHSFKARLASLGISSAHKDEGPGRNIKISQNLYNSLNHTASKQDLIHERIVTSIKYKEDKQSDPKVAFPPNNMYNENIGDDAALVVQQYTNENIPLQPSEWQAESNKDVSSAVLAGAIQLQYLYENVSITLLDFFYTIVQIIFTWNVVLFLILSVCSRTNQLPVLHPLTLAPKVPHTSKMILGATQLSIMAQLRITLLASKIITR